MHRGQNDRGMDDPAACHRAESIPLNCGYAPGRFAGDSRGAGLDARAIAETLRDRADGAGLCSSETSRSGFLSLRRFGAYAFPRFSEQQQLPSLFFASLILEWWRRSRPLSARRFAGTGRSFLLLWKVDEFLEGSNRPVQTAAFRFEFGQNPWDVQRGHLLGPENFCRTTGLTDKWTGFVPFSEQNQLRRTPRDTEMVA